MARSPADAHHAAIGPTRPWSVTAGRGGWAGMKVSDPNRKEGKREKGGAHGEIRDTKGCRSDDIVEEMGRSWEKGGGVEGGVRD